MILVFFRLRESLLAENHVSVSELLYFKSSLLLPEHSSLVSSAKKVESALMLVEKSFM